VSKNSVSPTAKQQLGFSLVEIMVGLAIGMLASLVIIQVMSIFETQKRTTTGSADAQTNGGIALYTIGSELQMAGYPLMPVTNSPLECTTTTYGSTGITSISPVSISNGVAVTGTSSASDSITIRYGTSLMGGTPTQITAVGAPSANDVTVGNNFGCRTADISLITNGTTCALSNATIPTGTTTRITLANITGAINGANISCLGTWNEVTYAVSNGNLQRNGQDNVADIVNIQAQYGISTSAISNQVTQWVDASGTTWATPSVAERNRIKAIRIAIVARNPKMEPVAVTGACSSTTTAAPTGLCAWEGSTTSPAPTINLSDTDANWLRYRYRVFETIIPLRNVIWAKDTL